MGTHIGRIEPQGPFIEIRVMASPDRVAALKAAGLAYPEPADVRGLIDTGASGCAIDIHILAGLGIRPTGETLVHTPTSGPTGEFKPVYDVSLVLGFGKPEPRHYTVGVLGAELASQGFCALLGWDILRRCDLICKGPSGKCTLRY